MKNLLKIGSLSLALVAVVFMMNTKAANDTGTLNLRITGTSGSCTYGTTLNLGDYNFQYNAHTVSGNFLTTTGEMTGTGAYAWHCTDSAGVSGWVLSIASTDVVNTTTNNPSHTIPATSVKIYNPTATVVSGACASVGGSNNGSNLSGSKAILEKISAAGESCRVQTSFVDLTVDLAASQAIGQYSGTLTVNVPSL